MPAIKEIRKKVSAILRRHEKRSLGLGPGCAFCRIPFPCDAYRLAKDLLKLAEVAEFIRIDADARSAGSRSVYFPELLRSYALAASLALTECSTEEA